MKDDFKEYLDSLELSSEAIENNIENIFIYASKLCSEEILDIFVCDYIKEDNSRDYESLWLFSKSFVMEIRNFRSNIEYDIDVANLSDSISYFRTRIKDYDFIKASEKSRMSIDCMNFDTINFILKASRNNCDKLALIIEKYVKSNM